MEQIVSEQERGMANNTKKLGVIALASVVVSSMVGGGIYSLPQNMAAQASVVVSNIMGYGNQKGYKTTYRGSEYVVNLIPKVKIETIAADDVADKIIFKVCERISTGKIGDGKIFVYDVADVVRIRTGERGETAL